MFGSKWFSANNGFFDQMENSMGKCLVVDIFWRAGFGSIKQAPLNVLGFGN